MKRYKIFFLILASIAACITVSYAAQNDLENSGLKTVKAIGDSIIYENDIQNARTNAIEEALISAVENAAIEIVPSDSLAKEFLTVNEVVFKKAKEFISSYKVISEVQTGQTFRTAVEACVSIDKIIEALSSVGLTVGSAPLPRILFFITEQLSHNFPIRSWWSEYDSGFIGISEEILSKVMKKQGFFIISHKIDNFQQILSPLLSDNQALKIGADLEADVIIIGSASAQKALNVLNENMDSYKGMVQLRAVTADRGVQIAVVNKSEISFGAEEIEARQDSISKASTAAGQELAENIAATWEKYAPDRLPIQIIVTGSSNLGEFIKFRKILNSTPGVSHIQIKEITANQYILTANYKKEALHLAEALMYNDFKFFGISVSVSEESEDVLKVELIPAEGAFGRELEEQTIFE